MKTRLKLITIMVVGSLGATVQAETTLPSSIVDADEIRVGSQGNFPPVEYTREGESSLTGFSHALLTEVGMRLGVKIRWVQGEYSGLLPGLAANRWDMSSGGMTDQIEREEVVDFVNYFASGGSVLLRAEDVGHFATIDDLCGESVAVLQGSAPFIAAADEATGRCAANGLPAINMLKLTSSPDAKQQLDIGRVKAYLTDYVSAAFILAQQPESYAIMGGDYTFTTWYFSWAFPKQSTDLRDAIRDTLQTILDDGTYQKILDEWGVPGGALSEITVNIEASKK